jgi:hypothetical protein
MMQFIKMQTNLNGRKIRGCQFLVPDRLKSFLHASSTPRKGGPNATVLKAHACRIDIQPLIALARCWLRGSFLLSLSRHEIGKTTVSETPSAGGLLPLLFEPSCFLLVGCGDTVSYSRPYYCSSFASHCAPHPPVTS